MISEEIIQLIVSVIPSIVSFLTSIGVGAGILKKFKSLKDEVSARKEYEELKKQCKLIVQENLTLKKKINELLTSIDKVNRG